MDIDIDGGQAAPAPDPFAANRFKVRKQRHTRPLRTVTNDDDGDKDKNSKQQQSTESVVISKDDDGMADDSKATHGGMVPDTGNGTEDRSGGGNAEKSGEDDEAEEGISMAEILRRRKMGRTKKAGGLDFVAEKPKAKMPLRAYDQDAAEKDAIDQDVNAVVNRFTHTQGAIVNVDEHMMKFIESELQKRRLQESGGYSMDGLDEEEEAPLQRSFPAPLTSTKLSDRKLGKWPIRPDFRGPAIGKLQEIDLGTEHTKKNIARTEEARRRLQAGEPLALQEPDPEEDKKRKKNKKKRTEEDIQRDRMVEEVLKESRLEIYEEPDPSAARANQSEEFAADDKIAEQFRREFMEALLARRRGRSNHHHKKRDETRKPRGPKLGGSRAARAAMRESERQAAAAAAAGGGGGSGALRR